MSLRGIKSKEYLVPHLKLNSLGSFSSPPVCSFTHGRIPHAKTPHRYAMHRLTALVLRQKAEKKSCIVIFFTVACEKSEIVSVKNSSSQVTD